LQELTCLVHRGGSGISHAIGTGGRDLWDQVGGLTTFAALDALERDPATRIVAVLGKPPGSRVLGQLVRRIEQCRKPAVLCLLGAAPEVSGRVRVARTIDEAAAACLETAGMSASPETIWSPAAIAARAHGEARQMSGTQRFVRGLFAGGTFCYQAQLIARDAGLVVWSNAPLEDMRRLPDVLSSREHSFVDMGAEELVLGRPHPMIDSALRRRRLADEAADPEVAVLLLDFILGQICSADPAGDLAPAIARARNLAGRQGRYLAVVASVCGTELDRQNLESQVSALEQVGVVVFPSAEQAARCAVQIACALERR
jgi:hypothetical protein